MQHLREWLVYGVGDFYLEPGMDMTKEFMRTPQGWSIYGISGPLLLECTYKLPGKPVKIQGGLVRPDNMNEILYF